MMFYVLSGFIVILSFISASFSFAQDLPVESASGNRNYPDITVTEINYHPDSTINSGDWIEFHNYGSAVINLGGWLLYDDVVYHEFLFPANTVLAPGGFILLAEDTNMYKVYYPGSPVSGQLGFGFDNGGEKVILIDHEGDTVINLSFSDGLPWPVGADELGRTLELKEPGLEMNDPGNWQCGCMSGTPGLIPDSCGEAVVISEVNYHSALFADGGDWIELHNRGAEPADLSGWIFSDSKNDNLFPIPGGTVIPAHGYLVLYEDQDRFTSLFPSVENAAGPFHFNLDNGGEALRLFNQSGTIAFSMIYDDENPWPVEPDGQNKTLEILSENGDFCDPLNWFAGCPMGSPGKVYSEPCGMGWPELENPERLKIWPNPAADGIYVLLPSNFEKGAEIKVMDLTGRLVAGPEKADPLKEYPLFIQLDHLLPGIYQVIIRSGNGSIYLTEKIVLGE